MLYHVSKCMWEATIVATTELDERWSVIKTIQKSETTDLEPKIRFFSGFSNRRWIFTMECVPHIKNYDPFFSIVGEFNSVVCEVMKTKNRDDVLLSSL